MIPLHEMQKVDIFKPLSEEMIEKLAALVDVTTAEKGDYLFHDGDVAESFYILKEGKVTLEFHQPDGSINTEIVNPGMGVGCPSLAGLPRYTGHARCETASRFLRWPQSGLQELFNEDNRLGYLLVKASSKMLSKRIAGKFHHR
ncbi:MAG: cyclic nucleotide-binding domain-containing protein [Deltaproteobacteria bacterium]|nr:cyclic nucleotide-binding domain-containing protein [Deltaproteobacteria bacterium]